MSNLSKPGSALAALRRKFDQLEAAGDVEGMNKLAFELNVIVNPDAVKLAKGTGGVLDATRLLPPKGARTTVPSSQSVH